jgi:hypothetical protein
MYMHTQVSSVGSAASDILTKTTAEVGTQFSEKASILTSTIQASIQDAGIYRTNIVEKSFLNFTEFFPPVLGI